MGAAHPSGDHGPITNGPRWLAGKRISRRRMKPVKRICANCRHWQQSDEQRSVIGVCHALPIQGATRITQINYWCKEFKRKAKP
jgi:hypothetical protein